MAKNQQTNGNGNGNTVQANGNGHQETNGGEAKPSLTKVQIEELKATLAKADKRVGAAESELLASKKAKSNAVEAIAKAIHPLTSFKLNGARVNIGSRDGTYFLKGNAEVTDLPDFG
jgi:hypothetical protein